MDSLVLFEIEKWLSLGVAALAFTGFLFTIRHRRFYSCWARSSILVGGVVQAMNSYYSHLDGVPVDALSSQMAVVHIGYSLAILVFTYTILRFKWGILKQYKKIIEQYECNPKIHQDVAGFWMSHKWPWFWRSTLHINKDINEDK